jgi:5-methyltetrahydrofolate--homocysteine methyltransferase
MHSLIQRLVSSAPVLTDGAWGTQFQTLGLQAGELADTWNLAHPGWVEDLARAYVAAGSQIILTNTFRANRVALDAYRLADRVDEINRSGVEISRRAAGGRAYVFASIGPSGKLLVTGEVTESELRAAFAEQARALAAAGAHGLVVETMSDLVEARVAVEAARETGLPVVACLVFDSGKDKDRTMMGTTPKQAAKELTAAGADVIGANCGEGVEQYLALCRRLRAATDRPIWLKPNAGLPELVCNRVTYRMGADEFAKATAGLAIAGATFVGGCCGTSPEFIQALCQTLAEDGWSHRAEDVK